MKPNLLYRDCWTLHTSDSLLFTVGFNIVFIFLRQKISYGADATKRERERERLEDKKKKQVLGSVKK